MRDVEERLGAALAGIADGAPQGVGLADAARRRYRRRRQRRAVVGAVVAVLALGLGAIALTRPSPQAEHVTTPSGGSEWQTIRHGEVRAEIPGDWRRLECDGVTVWAPDPSCADGPRASFYGSATFDPAMGPGVIVRFPAGDGDWSGYVDVGDQVLWFSDPDRDLVREVLASARLDGEPVVDAHRWVPAGDGQLRYDIPVGWGLPAGADTSGYVVCAGQPPEDYAAFVGDRDATHFAFVGWKSDQVSVAVVAPSYAVAQLVAASAEVRSAGGMAACAPRTALVAVEADGVSLEVPPTWQAHSCGGLPSWSPGAECRPSYDTEGVQLLLVATYRPAMAEGVLVRSGSMWGGYALQGKYAVFVTAADQALVAELLDRVH